MLIDISYVAEQTGLPASTLRFYEEKGLITSVGRRGLKRLFEPSILDQLALISLGREAGFSLDEIRMMFGPQGTLTIDRAQLMAKADELNKMIRRLTAMRDGLKHAAHCPAPNHMECPEFQRILRISKAARKRRSTPLNRA